MVWGRQTPNYDHLIICILLLPYRPLHPLKKGEVHFCKHVYTITGLQLFLMLTEITEILGNI